MKNVLCLSTVLLFSFNAFSQGDDDLLGMVGESCRARSDCRSGLKCVANVCAEQSVSCNATKECGGGGRRCIDHVCRVPAAAAPAPAPAPVASYSAPVQQPVAMVPMPVMPPPPAPQPQLVASSYPSSGPSLASRVEPSEEQDEDDILGGRHAYVGLAPGAGLLMVADAYCSHGYGCLSASFVNAPVALILGVWLGRVDLQLEIRPGTNFIVGNLVHPWGQVTVGAGYLARIYQSGSVAFGWMFRLSAGVNFMDDFIYNAEGVVRGQLFGVLLRASHFDLEFGVPATIAGGGSGLIVTAVPTLSFSYRF